MDEEARRADVQFIGPFTTHEVVVNGWQVPYLTATPLNGGRVALHLDHRFAIEIPVADAECIVPFIADCIAVAGGYTGHPGDGLDEPLPRHPMRQMRCV